MLCLPGKAVRDTEQALRQKARFYLDMHHNIIGRYELDTLVLGHIRCL
jgi:hypothetical protein